LLACGKHCGISKYEIIKLYLNEQIQAICIPLSNPPIGNFLTWLLKNGNNTVTLDTCLASNRCAELAKAKGTSVFWQWDTVQQEYLLFSMLLKSNLCFVKVTKDIEKSIHRKERQLRVRGEKNNIYLRKRSNCKVVWSASVEKDDIRQTLNTLEFSLKRVTSVRKEFYFVEIVVYPFDKFVGRFNQYGEMKVVKRWKRKKRKRICRPHTPSSENMSVLHGSYEEALDRSRSDSEASNNNVTIGTLFKNIQKKQNEKLKIQDRCDVQVDLSDIPDELEMTKLGSTGGKISTRTSRPKTITDMWKAVTDKKNALENSAFPTINLLSSSPEQIVEISSDDTR